MTKIPIPPAALEAGKLAYENYVLDIASEDAIRAAFLAIVEAWPGMLTDTLVLEHDNWGGTLRSETALILPLPPPPAGETSDE